MKRFLGIEPHESPAARAEVEQAERRLGFRLPASVREWNCNEDAIDILAKYRNNETCSRDNETGAGRSNHRQALALTRMKSTAVYKTLREVVGAWAKAAGFKRGSGGMLSYARPAPGATAFQAF